MNDSIGVFISYSRQTRFEAATLAQELSRVGCRCWIDFEGIAGGDVWRRSIEQGLQKTWLMVVVLTPESVQSQWVLYEVHSAIRFGHTVIPIMFRKCDIPRELEPYQYIDYTQGPDYDTLFRSILIAVARRLHQPLSPSPSTDHLTSVPRSVQEFIHARIPVLITFRELPFSKDILLPKRFGALEMSNTGKKTRSSIAYTNGS